MTAEPPGPSVPYGFPRWSFLYTIIFCFSFVACISASVTLRRSTKAITSCVCYAMYWYFVCKSIYSFCRIFVLAKSVSEYINGHSSWLRLDEARDVGGFRLLGNETSNDPLIQLEQPPMTVKVALFIGDAALVSSCLWMLVLVLELLRLVKTTMDRGATAEKRMLYFYLYFNFWAVATYFTSTGEAFYSERFEAVLITAASVQSLVLTAVSFAYGRPGAAIFHVSMCRVFYLNRTGLNLESVECRVVQSPLYKRLKRIL
ncbi:hypothetical protein B5M09_007480 [Aphanomyces astaci]|uniref:Uncharacterized protein n=1 Tax=Aphanomyces astaci TaxID=112090 RepID=A0A3R7ZGJ2_APHAT|nr:hypothetical protein B5M09_007480 [Aphanomyces astaci]